MKISKLKDVIYELVNVAEYEFTPTYFKNIDNACVEICEKLDKLADYEDKQEQGLLIELKAPLGTKIWYLSYEEDYEQGWWDIDCGIYSLSWIHYHENKEFFLTRSEAEEALAKMGGK